MCWAEYTNTVTGEPEMAVYSVEQTDSTIAPFAGVEGLLEVKAGSVKAVGGEVVLSGIASPVIYTGEALEVRFISGGLEGVSSGDTLYSLRPASGTDRLPVVPDARRRADHDHSIQPERGRPDLVPLHPYTFNYRAIAGLPVPVPNPLILIGAVPPSETNGGEDAGNVAKVFYKDYKGTPWAGLGRRGEVLHEVLLPDAGVVLVQARRCRCCESHCVPRRQF